MRAEEFGGWKATNVGKGGRRPSSDPFNKSQKGHERNPAAKEYASQGMEGYHHYSEFQDTRNEKTDDRKDNSSQSKKSNSSNAANHSSSLIRNIVSRVAMVAVGAVVVVSEYQTIQEHEEQSTVASVTWNWSLDNQSATVGLLNNDNTLIKELPTIVYSSQEDPTCTEEGTITYIATAKDNGKTFTDTHTDTLPALGHDHHFVEKRIENGKTVLVYECSRCHDKFTVTISGTES